MVFSKYKNLLDKYVNLTPEAWQQLKKLSTISEHKKNTIIHHSGSINTKFSHINYGLIRAYIVNYDGDDITWDFHFNDETAEFYNIFVVDAAAFPIQSISRITFEVLEDCQIISIDHKSLQIAYNNLDNVDKVSRIFAELNGAYFQNRIMDRYTKNATQRYQEYIQKYPNISARVKQSYIASYLGIKPESLSRIKNTLKQSQLPAVNNTQIPIVKYGDRTSP